MSNPEPQVSVAICTYDRYPILEDAIASVLAQESSVAWELLVIDNSPDKAVADSFAEKHGGDPRVQFIYEARPGLSNARNVALRYARGGIIAYLDDDAVAAPLWVQNIWEAFEHFGDQAGIVGGKVEPIWGLPKPEWLPDASLGYVTVVDWGGELRLAKDTEWMAGANISFRRDALRAIGGFETSLGRIGAGVSLLSNEDTAITEKLKAAGYRVVYAPEASVRHHVPEGRLNREYFRRRAVWQAVSDVIGEPTANGEDYGAKLGFALDYLSSLPVKDRNIRGLWKDTDSAEEFRLQLRAIYNFAAAMMAGFPAHDRRP